MVEIWEHENNIGEHAQTHYFIRSLFYLLGEMGLTESLLPRLYSTFTLN